jgi:hypothetical protein
MARRLDTEFYCSTAGGGCGCYFNAYLRDNMWGNYVIECPKCKHHHFRKVISGEITDDRHDERMGETTVLLGLLCTVRDIPRHEDPAYKRNELRAL